MNTMQANDADKNADDVREALAQVLVAHLCDPFPAREVAEDDRHVADAVLAAFDVRPHRTVSPSAGDVREALEKLITLNDPRGLARPASAVEAILAAFEVRPRGTATDAEAKRIREAIGPKFHGLSYRERLIVRAVLEAAREVRS